MQPVSPLRTATRLLLTFVFVLLLALGVLAVVHLAGFVWVLLVLVPGLVVLIYLLPGHGERDPDRPSPEADVWERPPSS